MTRNFAGDAAPGSETMNGLIINGKIVQVPGVIVENIHTVPWARLHPRDCKLREKRVNAVIQHTTKGIWPQQIKQGHIAKDRIERVADFWNGDPAQSAAHIVVGGGRAVCLVDLVNVEAFHATNANPCSVGIETYQEADGTIYADDIAITVAVTRAICDHMSIAWQIPHKYLGPLARWKSAPWTMYGVFGHRDQTDRRGKGDPGNAIMDALATAGAERLDFAAGQDIELWRDRQRKLGVTADGRPGTQTLAAWRDDGRF